MVSLFSKVLYITNLDTVESELGVGGKCKIQLYLLLQTQISHSWFQQTVHMNKNILQI